MLPLGPLPAMPMSQAQASLLNMSMDGYSPSYYQDQYAQAHSRGFSADFQAYNQEADLSNNTSLTDAGPAVTVPADMQKNNQEQIAALVNSREREVNELQTTLAVPLAHFNAKFIWHCIMNIERDCEYVYLYLFFIVVNSPTLPREATWPGIMRRSRSRTRGRDHPGCVGFNV